MLANVVRRFKLIQECFQVECDKLKDEIQSFRMRLNDVEQPGPADNAVCILSNQVGAVECIGMMVTGDKRQVCDIKRETEISHN